MNNLDIYNAVRKVPEEAKKKISGGRLNGKTDINPMWRIKALTERFGPCGIGWKYDLTKQWTEQGADGAVAAFVNIDLRYKYDGEWSEPITGTGGSAFVDKERSGLYTNDECYKMALTDAISVACKALGLGADVYWEKDTSKYNSRETPPAPPAPPPAPDVPDSAYICPQCGERQRDMRVNGALTTGADIIAHHCGGVCHKCWNAARNMGQ